MKLNLNRNNCLGRISGTTVILIAAVAAAIGMWAGSRWINPSASLSVLKTAVMYPSPQTVGDFSLQQANGQPLTQADLRGRWTLSFFGFTHCPDVCPNTLAVFKQVWNELPAEGRAKKLRFNFISVDPERDTPDQLQRYVSYFNPEFVAATGSHDELSKLTRSLGLLYARADGAEANYNVDHSAAVVLVDPQGRRAGLFRPPFEAGAIKADLLTLIDSN